MIDFVKWEFNNHCNLSCPYCIIENAGHKSVLSLDEKLKVIDKLIDMNVKVIDFFGKEPLYDDEMFKLIDYAEQQRALKEKDPVKYTFITNGVNLGLYKLNILRAPIDSFSVSFSGDKGRSFMPDWNLISWFIQHNTQIEMSVDIHKDNAGEAYGYYKIFKDCGMPSVYFKPIIKDRSYEMTDNSYLRFIKDFIQRGVPVYSVFDVPYFFTHTKSFIKGKNYSNMVFDIDNKCTAGKGQIFISCDGRVYGCGSACYAKSIYFTELDTTERLSDIKGRHCEMTEVFKEC